MNRESLGRPTLTDSRRTRQKIAAWSMRSSIAVLVVALSGLCRCASAREIYVNNVTGSDLFDGAIATNSDPGRGPYRSITRALKAALPGDHILVAKTQSPYRECVTLEGSQHSGTAYQPFSLESNGAVLDGSQSVPSEAWQHVTGDVFRFQPLKKQYAQLFLDGAPAVRNSADQNEDWLTRLQPKEWALAGGWIYFCVGPHKLPQEYPLTYAVLPVGLTLYKVENVVISGLVIQNFQIDGVNLNDAAGPTVLTGLSCQENGRSGIAIVGASQTEVQSCVIGGNAQCQLLLAGYSTCNLRNCQIGGNAGPKWEIHDGAKLLIDGAAVQRN